MKSLHYQTVLFFLSGRAHTLFKRLIQIVLVLRWENLVKLLSLRETLMETLCSILSGNASAILPAAVCIVKLRCARYESDTVWWCQFMLAAEKST